MNQNESKSLFTGSPIILKWISIESNSSTSSDIKASITSVEKLSVNQQWADQSINVKLSRETSKGYGWMFVGTDLPHGTMVNWALEGHSEAGSFQPMVNVNYERTFSVTLSANQRKYHFFHCTIYIYIEKSSILF